ncbi:MAG: D-glycero-beta-D-manno-heptose 1-phosphate adenylyltransferase [Nitrospirota bacterium]
MDNKLKGIEELKEIVKTLKNNGEKIVFTNGCFDLIHRGHIFYLQEAKKYGDRLIVAINSDKSINRIKGDKRPITPEKERALTVASLQAVDYVTIFDKTDPLEIITELEPDILIKGGDWKIEEVIGREIIEKRGGKVFTIPPIKGVSTTEIIKRIIEK